MFSPRAAPPPDSDLFFLPYWRFKGVRFFCSPDGIHHRFLDISRSALPGHTGLFPLSLGLRSQALTLGLVSDKTQGYFIKPAPFKEALQDHTSVVPPEMDHGNTFFHEDIGEMTSLIFSPFYKHQGRLFDAVLNQPLTTEGAEAFAVHENELCHPAKATVFIPGICPGCGWNLEGHSDSLALVCRNCNSLWRARGNGLAKLRFGFALPDQTGDVYLPFWRIGAGISGINISSFADLVKEGNLPMVVQPGMANQELLYWAPAFKIRPKIFLRLTTQLLIHQPGLDTEKQIPNRQLHPVTLPASQAVESIRITLASLLKPGKEYLPLLARAQVKPKRIDLVYLPFQSGSHELFYPGLHSLSISRRVLALSGNL